MMKLTNLCLQLRIQHLKDAIAKIQVYGRGALMAKADIKSAFRAIDDSPYCIQFVTFFFGFCFFDKCLPIGCALSCAYFEDFSSFLSWVVCFE